MMGAAAAAAAKSTKIAAEITRRSLVVARKTAQMGVNIRKRILQQSAAIQMKMIIDLES